MPHLYSEDMDPISSVTMAQIHLGVTTVAEDIIMGAYLPLTMYPILTHAHACTHTHTHTCTHAASTIDQQTILFSHALQASVRDACPFKDTILNFFSRKLITVYA